MVLPSWTRRLLLPFSRRYTYEVPAAGFVAWHAAPIVGAIAFEGADGSLVTRW